MPIYTTWLNPISPKPDWDMIANSQPLQEAVMRTVSSIVYSHDELELEETKIASISDRITSKLRPLVNDPLLREAFDIWRAVQRSPQRIVALTDGKTSLESPDFEIDEGVSMLGVLGTDSLGTPIVTFPAISLVATSELLHPGYVLRTSNPLYVSGAIEAEYQVKRVRERG
ncbi:hypothetical protein N7451_008831 [Penicillium sp. IBT 35674x]|nr:hypothetical protein N7451_008831 [Penicillium sp. IBT 35674x]